MAGVPLQDFVLFFTFSVILAPESATETFDIPRTEGIISNERHLLVGTFQISMLFSKLKYTGQLSGARAIGNPMKRFAEVFSRRNLCFLSISEI